MTLENRVPSFDARLRLPGQTRLPLNVVVDVSDERMVIISGREQLGEWALDGLLMDSRPDGFHLTLDQEEIILNVTDPAGFAAQLLGRQPVGEESRGRPVVDTPRAEHNVNGKRRGISGRLDDVDLEDRYEDVKLRISMLARAVIDESISPEEFFGRWLRLLKEINRRHGQSAIPSRIFYKLNTELLDLMPEPAGTPPPQVVESKTRASQLEAT